MVFYSCEKCGKNYNQKGRYDTHINKKVSCAVIETKHNLGQYFTTHIELKEKVKSFILNNPSTILEPSIGQGDLITCITDKIPSITFDMYEIDTKIKSEGKINMVFFIDKNDLSIFKDGNCVYTTQNVDQDIINSITSMIWSRFSERISDVVQLYNNIMDRKTFMKLVSQAKTEIQVINLDENGNIIDPINHFQKDETLTLDGILDKINQVGYDGLTQIEKDFLKNHK